MTIISEPEQSAPKASIEAGNRLVVVSNRLPPLAPPSSPQAGRIAPVGGLVSAVKPALTDRGGLWFGWSGEARQSSDGPKMRSAGPVQLAALDLTRDEVELFYNEFSNRTLWPLLHGFPSKTSIRYDAYDVYRETNRKFAQALLPLLREGDLVWVHDYHLLPLGHELRALGWGGKLGWFLHTPFPPGEVFSILPWAAELLRTLLAYDLAGLHTKRYVRNLYDALTLELPRGVLVGDVFFLEGKPTTVRPYPVGIDVETFQLSVSQTEAPIKRVFGHLPPDHLVVLGVDRLDYTKGIPFRLQAFERMLQKYPDLHGNVSLLQISVPSRGDVPEYIQERDRVDQLVGRINGECSEPHWVPIRYLYRSYPQQDLAAFYRRANVCLITPLADGMNLVAKEYVAAQDPQSPGVLVLSKFCGAAETMGQAVIVNPYDVESAADALYRALTMPLEDRKARRDALMEGITQYTAEVWSQTFLADLSRG